MNKKTFYKYKSLDNFEFLLDILLRERLFASQFSELNDPMEGVIEVERTVPRELAKEWEAILSNLRICCFTPDNENALMWAHYADGGRGCMIEFVLHDDYKPIKVSYAKKPILCKSQLTTEQAIKILQYKDKSWKYEREYRCITSDVFVPITVKGITFGPRVPKSTVELLQGILSCCKPNLRVFQNKGNGDTVFSTIPVSIGANKIFIRNQEGNDDCEECLKMERYRSALLGNRDKTEI
ncbi:DUF2971 domain-containing protein [Vibrio vulnificus]|uniref:DUF2971 domain-containing protein n=1 Tax=Vibrio vulnificus TaxID=672 RepID=UPI001029B0E0|nr:DUF2971 domain-containing protein [Vibrio vulnificus]EHU9446835.1 DUF2971 domain-containing protein [Vibrio vulnificus]MCU8501191.1 DUF2971 domain-containing protein [Vibrio vulnificus]RZP95721.1 DUF2971 domain-containing protein [Vibrio vulnificus]HDU8731221.1 DUF2971 domain-containing protein [Vibrio vulnificus]HDU8767897.1 DUF2971 domain-containing protein [Vibrio vulnificus]